MQHLEQWFSHFPVVGAVEIAPECIYSTFSCDVYRFIYQRCLWLWYSDYTADCYISNFNQFLKKKKLNEKNILFKLIIIDIYFLNRPSALQFEHQNHESSFRIKPQSSLKIKSIIKTTPPSNLKYNLFAKLKFQKKNILVPKESLN